MRKRASDTQTAPMRQREQHMPAETADVRREPGSELMKNLATAAALVLCAVMLRAGAVPSLQGPVDAVLTAVTGDTLLNEQLGRLSFVSAMFPEAVLVFGEQETGVLALPVSGGKLAHGWSAQEPYTTWRSEADTVCAAIGGEVTGVYHGVGEEILVQIAGEGGLSCVHGNLAASCVAMGDQVRQGDAIGTLLPGEELALEVRQNGRSIDPVPLLP